MKLFIFVPKQYRMNDTCRKKRRMGDICSHVFEMRHELYPKALDAYAKSFASAANKFP